MASSPAWKAGERGLVIRFRLTPRAARDAVEALGPVAEGMAVLVRVRAVPEMEAANAALERLVADWLDVPASAVSVIAGGKSRTKTVQVAGPLDALQRRIAAAIAALAE